MISGRKDKAGRRGCRHFCSARSRSRCGGRQRQSAHATQAKDFKGAATNSYKAAEGQGVVINQDSFKKAIADIKDQANDFGVDPNLAPRSTAVLNRLDQEAAEGDLTFKKAMTLRRVATSALSTPDKSDRAVTHVIINGLTVVAWLWRQ